MYYLDKRDKNGLLLSYSAFDLANEISNYCYKEIKKTEIYEILATEFQNNYLEMYFKTFFYINAVPIAHKVVLLADIQLDASISLYSSKSTPKPSLHD